ncbi:MAG: hypothetical protein GXP51_09155 [Deltaproteobacteria bacterium]|nr:hypothetical protein [Deltaproteobacteria bacterium]
MRQQKFLFGLLLLSGLLIPGLAVPPEAAACAGYTITVGSDGSRPQELLTQIMAELIRQRTGTNIRLVRYKTEAELLAAAGRHDIDLLVATLGPAGSQLFKKQKLLALKPFGYQSSRVVPVFRVETLKKFPALRRLINRLAGKIDDDTLRRLIAELDDEQNVRVVAKKFLAEQKLVFGG